MCKCNHGTTGFDSVRVAVIWGSKHSDSADRCAQPSSSLSTLAATWTAFKPSPFQTLLLLLFRPRLLLLPLSWRSSKANRLVPDSIRSTLSPIYRPIPRLFFPDVFVISATSEDRWNRTEGELRHEVKCYWKIFLD